MLSLLLWIVPRPLRVPARRVVIAGVVAAIVGPPAALADADAPAAGPAGVALVPHDAAFLSSSLRLRQQYDMLVGSNAYKAIMNLPAFKRALDSYDEQRSTPGSPFSTVESFLELPDNKAAAELLADMVATDTFVYGEPSCVSFWKLVRTVMEAQQRAGLAAGREDMVVEEMPDDDAADDDLKIEAFAADVDTRRGARVALETLADNLDLLVVPDVVWGFKTTKRDVAVAQLDRLETLAASLLEGDPDGATAVARRKIAGGEVLTFTVDGSRVPWADVERELAAAAGDDQRAEQVFDRLRDLDLVLAVGLVGDWVIVSLGDSADHLDKLAIPGSGRKGLLDLPVFAPLRADAGRPLTAVSYVSESFAEAVADPEAGLDSMVAALDGLETVEELPAEAVDDIRGLAKRAAGEYGRRLPQPGPWMGYSFLTDRGYEGYAWNWSRNQPFDGDRRLDLLEHVGGAPLAVLATRIKSDRAAFDAAVEIAAAAWQLGLRHGRPSMDDDERKSFDALAERLTPFAARLVTALREKVIASLADGQIALVLDAKGRAAKPQRRLPSSAEPLPIVEPGIVLPVADPKLFKDGLNDLFALADEFTEAVRELDPRAMPETYRIPEPDRAKSDGGSVWSWALANAGLDEQIRPAIGVGDEVVVLSLVPKQAGRMLAESGLETGTQLTKFDEPLAAAAAVDVAGLIDAARPWVVYLTRYGCVQQREGEVDPRRQLSADDETPEAKDALEHVAVILEALKSLRVAVAETSYREGALVTHWRNVIRDMPAK
jgi:hypothetical protein